MESKASTSGVSRRRSSRFATSTPAKKRQRLDTSEKIRHALLDLSSMSDFDVSGSSSGGEEELHSDYEMPLDDTAITAVKTTTATMVVKKKQGSLLWKS